MKWGPREAIRRARFHYRPIEAASSTSCDECNAKARGDWTPGGEIVPMSSCWQDPEKPNESPLMIRNDTALLVVLLAAQVLTAQSLSAAERPNILVAISDDQSFPHSSAYGYATISTPGFDRVAQAGVLFQNAFTPAPGCSRCRRSACACAASYCAGPSIPRDGGGDK